jgi:hypothetical protein
MTTDEFKKLVVRFLDEYTPHVEVKVMGVDPIMVNLAYCDYGITLEALVAVHSKRLVSGDFQWVSDAVNMAASVLQQRVRDKRDELMRNKAAYN